MNGTLAASSTGDGQNSENSAAVLDALGIVHNPTTNNERRLEATRFLNDQKDTSHACQSGYFLASGRDRPDVVRHFGLSLIEHNIRQKWHDLLDDQAQQVHSWTLQLAQDVRETDPAYIRNKIAALWVELAKQSWAVDWFDMDTSLLALWNMSLIGKDLVLTILENLFEDTFSRDDAAAALRGQELNTALVEIFTPASVYTGQFKVGNSTVQLRHDDDGWLVRIVHLIQECTSDASRQSMDCLTKALTTLRSVLAWIMLPAIVATNCLPATCSTLGVQDAGVLMAAVQVLYALYERHRFDDSEYRALICPMYQTENVALLRTLFDWSVVSADEVESPKYAISKKFSETISFLSDHIERGAGQLDHIDFAAFFQFMVSIANHPSPVVSIPIMHAWIRLLTSPKVTQMAAFRNILGSLLEISSRRILRYELLPEDSDDAAMVFVTDEIEALPDRHAFLGNFRRFCYQAVEFICAIEPEATLTYLLSQADHVLQELEQRNPLDPAHYSKSSEMLLRIDAVLTAVEAGIKGYGSLVFSRRKEIKEHSSDQEAIENRIETWATALLDVREASRSSASTGPTNAAQDPGIKQRITKTVVEISNRALSKKETFALKVLEYLLGSQLPDQPQYSAYSDAVKDLHAFAAGELRRLASKHADYFVSFYDELDAKVREISANQDLGEKAQAELPAALLIIMQNAQNVDPGLRRERLLGFTAPIAQAWQDFHLKQSLESLDAFTTSMSLDKVIPYLQSINSKTIEDWSITPLAPEAVAIRNEMNEKYARLPLRHTKTVLGVSVDKVAQDSQPYQVARELWSPVIPVVLPNVLHLISYAHRLHNPEAWPGLPSEVRQIAERVLQDRFWQAGISEGSMNDFYATINTTKASLEGFASATRGKLRAIRENSYSIIYSMSRLGDVFYGYEGLPQPLAEAVFASASFLSPHNFSILLDMAKRLIDSCPAPQRAHFLPPVLSTIFREIDNKCTSEWDGLNRRKTQSTNGDDLTGEMRTESILRQLCYKSVMLVTSLLDPQGGKTVDNHQPLHNSETLSLIDTPGSLRAFVLSNLVILEPLLLFCSNAIAFRDTRSSSIIIRTIRSIVPEFTKDDGTSAAILEYIASNVLKAAITSLHDSYFVDNQKDLASLIGTIWVAYGLPTHVPAVVREEEGNIVIDQAAYGRPPLTDSVRNLLLSLPGITEQRVDATAQKLVATGGTFGNMRQQRALVLGLLESLRGVRISELGKFDRDVAKEKSKLQEKYLRRENGMMGGMEEGQQKVDIEAEGEDGLGGVASLLG